MCIRDRSREIMHRNLKLFIKFAAGSGCAFYVNIIGSNEGSQKNIMGLWQKMRGRCKGYQNHGCHG
jgi:hypothetical protein